MNARQRRQYILDRLARDPAGRKLPPDRVQRVISSFELLMKNPAPYVLDANQDREILFCALLAISQEIVRPKIEKLLTSERLSAKDLGTTIF